MVTYVINTSENKTFDSDKLFELAGYNKIRWINQGLDKMKECVKEIFEKQNVLGADDFRIAVIIDFYGYDRIRAPYGKNGYVTEEGVDASLYLPFIEAYITDKLIVPLNKAELFPSSFEMFYAQNGNYEKYTFLDNDMELLRQIVSGKEETVDELYPDLLEKKADLERRIEERDKKAARRKKAEESGKDMILFDMEEEEDEVDTLANGSVDRRSFEQRIQDLTPYGTYVVYCTRSLSLEINLTDYPYGTAHDKMSYDEFYEAFRRRSSEYTTIHRHYYKTSYGGGAARSAFDTLSLSLYLVRLYEREGNCEEEEIQIDRLDPSILKDVLVSSWMKVSVARNVAITNQSKYFVLAQNEKEISEDVENRTVDPKECIRNEKAKLPKEILNTNVPALKLYDEIVKFTDRTQDEYDDENQQEFDKIIDEFLRKRDETYADKIQADFDNFGEIGALATTNQCPSKSDFELAVKNKQQDISNLFAEALKAEYIEVDLKEEKEKAKEAKAEYCKAKACMNKNILGDIIFLIITLGVMFLPYYFLQLKNNTFTLATPLLVGVMLGVFGGLFILAFFIQILPLLYKMRKARDKLKLCYIECCAKRRYSFSGLRQRYEKDLIRIEEARYELRQIKRLNDLNRIKEKHVAQHREMLELVQDKLSSMLNNLDVEPVYNPEESVSGEFDINKSFLASENKIYRIFSIETIEKMFSKKRGE